jgi:hypothetical protein
LLCTTRPFSTVISCAINSLNPSMMPPCTMLSAAPGLMIWLPTSAAAQTLFTRTLLFWSTFTSATSAK